MYTHLYIDSILCSLVITDFVDGYVQDYVRDFCMYVRRFCLELAQSI